MFDYLDSIARIQQVERRLNDIYADPEIQNPQTASALVRDQLADLQAERELLGPLTESILQAQISEVVADLNLTVGGTTTTPSAVSQHTITDRLDHLAPGRDHSETQHFLRAEHQRLMSVLFWKIK